MFRQMAQDRVVLYLMLIVILGLLLGFVSTLLIHVILSWHSIVTLVFDVLSMGVS
jgi:hypothetical protein